MIFIHRYLNTLLLLHQQESCGLTVLDSYGLGDYYVYKHLHSICEEQHNQ